MDFNEMRLLARQEAERLHKEWIIDELNEGLGGEKLIAMTRNDMLIDSEMSEVAADERRPMRQRLDAWTELEFIDLKKQTLDERNPRFIRKHQIGEVAQVSAPVTVKGANISGRLDEFLKDKREARSSLKQATLDEYRVSVRELIEVVGDVDTGVVTFELAKNYRDAMKKVPTNRTKGGYKGISISGLIAMDIPPEKCLSSKTIQGRLANLHTYFAWLQQCRLIAINPFEAVKIEVISESYKAYQIPELNEIFSSKLYKDSKYRAKYGGQSKWWLLVLGLFTGARLGELIQLQLEDVTEEDGIFSISVNDEGPDKTVKTAAGIRKFPVPPIILELGFAEYLQVVKSRGSERVLDGFSMSDRKPSDSGSKWYGNYKKNLSASIANDKKKVFHSFRHTMIQAALQCGADLTKLQCIVGHEPGIFNETSTYLETPFTQKQLFVELEKLSFEGLDLTLLHSGWQCT